VSADTPIESGGAHEQSSESTAKREIIDSLYFISLTSKDLVIKANITF
jgi:hypothetical protein